MATVSLYNMDGKDIGTTNLPDRIFGVKVETSLVDQAVKAQRANGRVAIAHTKTRGEVRGGGKKPWRQKGTGRARHGSIRSPIWKGGGVTFGPRSTRNYSQKINQKAKQKALFMTLSDKVTSKQLVVLDAMEMPQPKTKQFAALLKKLPVGRTTLVVVPTGDTAIARSCRNIPGVTSITANSLNVVDVLRHHSLMMPQQAVEAIAKTFTTGSPRG